MDRLINFSRKIAENADPGSVNLAHIIIQAYIRGDSERLFKKVSKEDIGAFGSISSPVVLHLIIDTLCNAGQRLISLLSSETTSNLMLIVNNLLIIFQIALTCNNKKNQETTLIKNNQASDISINDANEKYFVKYLWNVIEKIEKVQEENGISKDDRDVINFRLFRGLSNEIRKENPVTDSKDHFCLGHLNYFLNLFEQNLKKSGLSEEKAELVIFRTLKTLFEDTQEAKMFIDNLAKIRINKQQ